MRLPRKVVLPFLFAAAFSLAACSSSRPPAHVSPTPTASVPAAPSPSPSPSPLRTAALGQPFDVPNWRITVTGTSCAGASCVVHLAFLNTGASPAPFSGTAFGNDSPLDSAVATDGQGRAYSGDRQLVEVSNPGTGGTEDLTFDVAPGVRLVRLTLAGFTVKL